MYDQLSDQDLLAQLGGALMEYRAAVQSARQHNPVDSLEEHIVHAAAMNAAGRAYSRTAYPIQQELTRRGVNFDVYFREHFLQ